jgi:glutaredoxin
MFYRLCLFLCFVLPVQAEDIYQWVDADGAVYFSDREAPEGAVAMRITRQPRAPEQDIAALALETGTPKETDALAALPFAPPPKATPMLPLISLYTTPGCAYCVRAKQYFQQHAIPYQEYGIQNNRANLAAFYQAGGKGVPLILIGHSYRMTGFNPSVLKNMLQASGYLF